MQQRAALWISGTFRILPIAGIKAISGLIPIYLYIKKIYSKFLLRGSTFPPNHLIKSILNLDGSSGHLSHILSLDHLTQKQRSYLTSLLVDMDNCLNEIHLSFSPFDKEFDPGNCLIDSFSDCFSFHLQFKNIKNHIKALNDITLKTSSDLASSIVISDTSIKNYVVMSISHIHLYNKLIIKTIHQAVNVTSTEAELFTIQCGINQVISIPNISHIVVITDSLHTAKRIFNSSMDLYQVHSATISCELQEFFLKNNNNYIDFWDCCYGNH